MQIFTFGSNLAGRHGKGAALDAKNNWGAIYGVGEGLQGQSYAIPTKSLTLQPLSIDEIVYHIIVFLRFADDNPQFEFMMTRIGCGLAGYADRQIAPLFESAPDNMIFPPEWKSFLGESKKYHTGTISNAEKSYCV